MPTPATAATPPKHPQMHRTMTSPTRHEHQLRKSPSTLPHPLSTERERRRLPVELSVQGGETCSRRGGTSLGRGVESGVCLASPGTNKTCLGLGLCLGDDNRRMRQQCTRPCGGMMQRGRDTGDGVTRHVRRNDTDGDGIWRRNKRRRSVPTGPMHRTLPLPLSLPLLAVALLLHVVLVRGLEVVTPIIDHGQCYADLSEADADRSNDLTSTEYMVFISLQSNGQYAPDTPLADMPLGFASAFNLSACNCRDGSCCSTDAPPTVDIAGADLDKGQVPTEDQEKHLFHVCVAAFNAILQAERPPPTDPPTEEPTLAPTALPTTSPTAEPTASPTIFLFTGDLELTFTFPFENDGGFTAEDINNANGNTIKSDLEIAIDQMVRDIVDEQGGARRHQRGRKRRTRGLRHGRQSLGVTDADVDGSTSSISAARSIGHGGNEAMLDGRRHLTVAYNGEVPPTVVVEDVDCPDGTQEARAVAPNTKCSIVTATVTLSVEDESPDEVRSKYLQAIVSEIDGGALADVGVVGPAEPNFPTNSPEIMAGPGQENVTPEGPSEGALSTPAVIGIAVAAFAAGLVAVAGLYTQRRQQRRASKTDDFPPSPEVSTGKTQPPDSSTGTLGAAAANYGHASGEAPPASASMSASPAQKGFQEIQEVDPDDELSLASSDVSSSQAGSSGWSSSAGVSSINTGSHDGSSFDLEGGGARVNTLAALGVASGVTSRLDDRHGRDSALQFIPVPANQPPSLKAQNDGSSSTLEDVPTVPSVDRNDLDAAIEAGDWAAVGATAALLASSTSETGDSSVNTDSQSGHSASEGKLSDIDAERAAALDRMVDSGDWEGVVLAASKFETASVEESSRSRTDDDDEDHDNDHDEHSQEVVETRDAHSTVPSTMAGSPLTPGGVTTGKESANGALSPTTDNAGSASTGDASNGTDESSSSSSSSASASASASADDPSDSVLSPGASTHSAGASSGLSETPSKIQKRAEVRAEVESLVRRVVPDEIDNVDEMMTQFKGREEELVETLRTMQERSIAQRERVARNKSAKREAKLGVRRARKTQASLAASTGSTGSGLPPAGPHSASAAGNNIGAAAAIGTSTAVAMAVVSSSSKKVEEGGNDEKDDANPGSKAIGPVVSPLVNKEKDASIGLAPSLSQSRSSEGTNFSDSHFESSQTEASSAMASSAMSGSGMDSTDFEASTEYTSAAASKYDADASGTENESEEGSAPVNTSPLPDKSTSQSPATTQNTEGSGNDVKRARYALEKAIESGDWEAVGEAAALMSDNSVTSADTSELRNIANIGEYDSSGYMSEGTGSKRSGTTGTDTTGPNAERAAELDKKIAQGDWEGVVLAAKSFSKIDSATKKGAEAAESRNSMKSSTKSKSWRLRRMFGGGKGSSRTNASVDTDSEVDSVSKKNSDTALQEEQDALAQAEIWMAIAAQSKQEGTNEPTGASDAADWAISRSLSALQAEQKEDALKGDKECKGISSSSSMGSAGSKGDKSV